MINLAVFISGNGTNLVSILERIDAGELNAKVVCVVSSNQRACGIKFAESKHISVLAMNTDAYQNASLADEKILNFVKTHNADYIIMAGYMRKVTDILRDAFPNKILNIHPALLPSFKGASAIKDAWNNGVKVTGVTVHFANQDYDKGPIIAQEAISISEDDTFDTLESRIHELEHKIYPRVIQLLSENKIEIKDNKVIVKD